MDLHLKKMIDKLNYLYHDGINGGKPQQQTFTDYFIKLRVEGLIFSPRIPDINYEKVILNEYESKLFEKLQLIKNEEIKARKNNLLRYSVAIHDVITSLIHELSTLLMKRGALYKQYFWQPSEAIERSIAVKLFINEISPLLKENVFNTDYYGTIEQGKIAFIKPGRNVMETYVWWNKDGNVSYT